MFRDGNTPRACPHCGRIDCKDSQENTCAYDPAAGHIRQQRTHRKKFSTVIAAATILFSALFPSAKALDVAIARNEIIIVDALLCQTPQQITALIDAESMGGELGLALGILHMEDIKVCEHVLTLVRVVGQAAAYLDVQGYEGPYDTYILQVEVLMALKKVEADEYQRMDLHGTWFFSSSRPLKKYELEI